MKKFFTLICALVATVAASASTTDDVSVCKHSIVVTCDDYTGNGTVQRVKETLFGANCFLDVTGGSVATNKGTVDLSDVSTLAAYSEGVDLEAIVAKYGEKYKGPKYNSLRLKNNQDVIFMKVTAGSKLIFIGQGNNKAGADARIPRLATTKDMADATTLNMSDNPKTSGNANSTPSGYVYTWTAQQDYDLYIGSFNGDMFLSYIIVEANEKEGTPSVELGAQTYDGDEGMWYRLVTCTPVAEVEGNPTCCTYTLDGTEPTADSPVYTEPLKIYENCTVKFQAFFDFDGVGSADELIEDATNEAVVEFVFDAPTIEAEGANVTIIAAENGATNYYSINGGEWTEGNEVTLTESATISAKSEYENGEVTFVSKPVTKDVYVLSPVTEATTIAVTAGEVVVDQEATDADLTGAIHYMVKDGAISADKANFFVKNLTFGIVKNETEAEYQIDGKEVYIQMSNTTIDFELAESAAVTVICSKNACKNIASETVSDRACKIQVDGKQYGSDDILVTYDLVNAEGEAVETLDGNVVKFDLEAGHHQFQKYSGTGNIKVSSITIVPGESVFTAANVVAADNAAAEVTKTVENGKVVIVKNGKKFTAAGAQIK